MPTRPLVILTMALSVCAAAPAVAQVEKPDPSQPGNFALPDGAAKTLVQERCISCHDLRRVVNSNYSPEEWTNVVNMMASAGAPINKDEIVKIRDYLNASFPGKPRPQPVLVSGPVEVKFQEWTVPTPGSRPHDPLATPDGMLWWSGQFANKLGRLDPKTGEMKEFELPVRSGPHGLINDQDGNIWYAANFGGYIGKLDPKTGQITQFKMPDPAARDPHTPLFDKNGMLWFSVQNGGFIGRLDPKSGEIKLVVPPSGNKSQPYALRIGSDGTPYYSLFAANKIVKVDPKTMDLTEFVLPDAGTRIRRMGMTSDDMIWYGDYAKGKLGRLDPKTGKATEWNSPGGALSQPYGLTVINDIIWYCESNLRPNTLVRFDPKTEKFQTFLIPSGGGIVRHMMPTRDGKIAMANSGVNGVGLVEIK
jgi:virginiamycin B lyase